MSRIARSLVITLALLTLAGCAAVRAPSPARNATAAPSAPPYEAWAHVLARHVDDQGRIDFAGAAANRTELDRFVSYVYAVGPRTQPGLFPTQQHVLAYYINAYNALSMYKVIEVGIPETNAGLRKVLFFAFGKVQVGGEAISLYDFENKFIRTIGDPRIHMALNCMSVGCPRLPREVFLPETLDQQLDRETRRFFSEPRNLMVDHAARTVTYSEILKFFTSDFLVTAPTLTAFVNRYTPSPIPEDYKVAFFEYDWTINKQPRR
jgi:hypothetical protein